jgi:hypothetical protein
MSKRWNRFRATLAKSPLRRPVIWVRHRGLNAADVFLASYPRSGNTWLRFVLAEVLTGQAINFDNVDRFIPELKLHSSALPILQNNGHLIKTHEAYRKEYKRAVYIVRDIRDVALSTYARAKQIGIVDPSLDGFLKSFLRGRAHNYGAWAPHVRSWLDGPLAASGNLLVVKFEELRRSPQEVLRRMADFLGVAADAERICTALDNNSVERMRSKEERSKKLFKSTSEEGRFVRKGAVQGWRTTLSPAQLQLFEEYAGAELVRLGYPNGCQSEPAASPAPLQIAGIRN